MLAEVPQYVSVNNLCRRCFITTGGKTAHCVADSISNFKPLDGLLVVIPLDLSRVCIYPFLITLHVAFVLGETGSVCSFHEQA